MSKARNYRKSEEKLNILKLHLVEKKPISEVCEAESIQPSVFYRWQQELFEHGAVCFERSKKRTVTSADKQRIEFLEKQLRQQDKKLMQKNEVIAELLEEHTTLKKSLGEN